MGKLKIIKMNKQKAFTLAEVLVTFAVVGIVASMVIPPLMENYKENVWKKSFKRIYTDFNSAYLKSVADGYNLGYETTTTLQCFNSQVLGHCLLEPYYPNAVFSGNRPITKGAIPAGYEIKYLLPKEGIAQTSGGIDDNFRAAIILNSGAYIIFPHSSSSWSNIWQRVYVDVNGYNGPNMLGKDCFRIIIVKINGEGQVRPGGSLYDFGQCRNCSTTQELGGNGEGCAIKVLQDQDY